MLRDSSETKALEKKLLYCVNQSQMQESAIWLASLMSPFEKCSYSSHAILLVEFWPVDGYTCRISELKHFHFPEKIFRMIRLPFCIHHNADFYFTFEYL